MIVVYYTLLDKKIPDTCIDAWLAELAPDQARRIERQRGRQQRASSLLGLQLLKQACQTLDLGDFALADIHYPARGKPHWRQPLDFNITHSHNLIACAATTACRVGIDVEWVREYQPAVARRISDKSELARIEQAEDAFFDIWTAKEAVVKACGEGIGSLRAVHTHQDDADFNGERWILRPLPLATHYKGHLALDKEAIPSVLEPVTIDELCDETSQAATPLSITPPAPASES